MPTSSRQLPSRIGPLHISPSGQTLFTRTGIPWPASEQVTPAGIVVNAGTIATPPAAGGAGSEAGDELGAEGGGGFVGLFHPRPQHLVRG